MPTETQIEPLVQYIRDALWRTPERGLASVMVGAGFSLNAEPVLSGARDFPLWDELADKMALGIGLKSDRKLRDPLLIAQMYASMHGHSDLRRLIERSIPDAEHKPSKLHHRLLALPWADVFTTNYDTLLEQACREVSNRRYEVVLSSLDIPMKQPQRLVKLHGTLGSGGRLIATQEDYRRYPQDCAPFVNMVRQSVMETVFVLIGFTGEDPNFLEWTGWVRDVLGNDAPKIYLCGLGDSSPAARALLDSRGVTLVDLSEVVIGVEKSQRHAKALDWFLAALEIGEQSRPLGWAPTTLEPTPVRQPPLPKAKRFTALAEVPRVHFKSDLDVSNFRQTYEIWKAQRIEYPGWHVAPDAIRERVGHGLDEWRRLFFLNGEMLEMVERVRFARELCWRLELCLSPVFTNETTNLAEWLEGINPFGAQLDLPNATETQVESPETREAWSALALHVLRTAREDLDEVRYACWRGRLLQISAGDASLKAELEHEEVLLQWNRLDFAAYRKALDSWRSTARQPLEFARLAVYYAELGNGDDAHELGLAAVNAARNIGERHSAISQEAWSSLLLRTLYWGDSVRAAEWRKRIDTAKENGYDPWAILDNLRDVLKGPRPDRQKEMTDESGFDAGDIRRVTHFSRQDATMPGYRLLRLIEKAPCPLRVGNGGLCAEAATKAAVCVGDGAPFWSLAILLRAGAKKEALHELFDRAAVACMEQPRVLQMYDQLLRVIDVEVVRLSVPNEKPDGLTVQVLPTALDILSRLALRLPEAALLALVKRSAQWLSSPTFIDYHDLHEPLGWLVKRIIETLPDEQLSSVATSFLRVPILGEAGCQPRHDFRWPEPFDNEGLGGRRNVALVKKPSDWADIWERLREGLRSEASASLRERSFTRTYLLHHWGWLSENESKDFGEIVWSHPDPTSGLPSLRGYYATVIMDFPHPGSINIEMLLRRKLLSEAPIPWQRSESGWSSALSEYFIRWTDEVRQVFSHVAFIRSKDRLLPISSDEVEALVQRLLVWWPSAKTVLFNPKYNGMPFGGFKPDAVVERFCIVIGEVILPRLKRGSLLHAELDEVLCELEEKGVSVARARIGWLVLWPESSDALFSELEKSLLSSDSKRVGRTTRAITSWRLAAASNLTPDVPIGLLRLLVACIVTRRTVAFDSAVNCLVGFVERDGLPRDLERMLLPALEHLASETEARNLRSRYNVGEIERVEVADGLHMRAWVGLLTSKLSKAISVRGEPLPLVLDRWREICGTDPLPEVRQAWRSEL